jgi:hypothetical protein
MLPAGFIEGVRELIALAKECPENLQEKCLEMLLEDFLKKSGRGSGRVPNAPPNTGAASSPPASEDEETPEASTEEMESTPGQRDLLMTDLHLKARKFLKQYSISLDNINQLFFMEDGQIKPLYDDLKSTKASETQVRIGLLQALRTGIKDGEFQFNGEDVRVECHERKAYDATNFSANFKNSAGLFSGFDKYNKNEPVLKLSDAGKQRLADTIKELQ